MYQRSLAGQPVFGERSRKYAGSSSVFCVRVCCVVLCHYIPKYSNTWVQVGCLRHTVRVATQSTAESKQQQTRNRKRGNHLWFCQVGLEFNKSHSTRISTMAHHNAFVRALTKMPQGTAIGVSVGVTCVFSALLTVMFTSKGKAASFASYERIF